MRGLSAFFFLALCFGIQPANAQDVVLDPADHSLLEKFFKDIDAGRIAKACANTGAISNQVASDLTTWVCLQKGGTSASFKTYTEFAVSHAHWPGHSTLRRKAEAAVSNRTPDSEILSWFDAQPALKGKGAVAYAAALKRAGREETLAEFVAKSWVELDFSRDEAKAFHRRYKSLITPEMELARLDRLLWDRKYSAAERQVRLVAKDQRKLAEARITLGRKRAGVDAAVRRVPAHLQDDPGLLYERARWRWRSKRRNDVADLLEQAGDKTPYPHLWWSMRHTVARKALRQGKVERAYRISSEHGMESGIGFADGEWLAGWISLRFLKQPRRGYEHFARLFYGVKSPISKARGAYWAGEAARVMGNDDWSKRWHKIAAGYRTTFYGQLAAHRLGRQTGLPINPHGPPSEIERKAFHNMDLVQAVTLLGLVKQTRYQDTFLSRLRLDAKTSADFSLTAKLARVQKRSGIALRVAKTAQRTGITLLEYLYPSIEVGEAEPETALTLALVRQESAFDEKAVSRAGARGLMQLMPATAKEVARSQKKKYDKERLTSDPAYNLILGQAYLAQVVKRFDGSYILGLAAYNAGPHRASSWVRQFGDPRDPGVDPIDWIEQIPFNETRNYVQRILESLSIYRLMLANGRTTPATMPLPTSNPFASWGHKAVKPCCY
ncbi:lytic transglycosylase domain-containing protein [Pelagibius sp. Alg239-R121]|uniref:lytic transglycosylase domain-containing protein n=1 Tax=Pelagibius sp. Alg239-R121 TaxID=2993448 RepID=UPI0024A72CFE|nr:lytic transglycosylase domain-containing protein [Pelagibius sp. Alg239-R121]